MSDGSQSGTIYFNYHVLMVLRVSITESVPVAVHDDAESDRWVITCLSFMGSSPQFSDMVIVVLVCLPRYCSCLGMGWVATNDTTAYVTNVSTFFFTVICRALMAT